MIIESISVCGFLGIGNTEKFQCQTEISKENKQLQNISHIKDSIFIKAFSIIFDSKFGAGCEMSEFINDDVEKPFVEVVLLQKDKAVLCDYIWLKDKQLVLTRYLKQPNQIFINGNKLDVSVFHQTISSLGYISFGSFQMHLLLDDEITRLRHFSGDDLWNLILKMNECEDLVNIIGKKHRMRQSLNKVLVNQMKDMEEALAEKLKSRNEIFSHLKLKRKFNTLIAIANKRKMKILRKESEVINSSLEKLEMELNYKHKVILDYKAEASLRKHDLLQQQSRLKLIQKERKDLQMKIFKSNNSKTPRTSEVFLEHRNRLVLEHQKTVNLIEELEASIGIAAKYASENFYQTQAQVEATKWKLALKEAKDQTQRELNLKQLNIELNSINLSISYFQQLLQETTAEIEVLKTEAMEIATLDLEQMNSVIKLNNDKQTETEKKILEINVEIFKHQEKVLDIDREIAKDAVEGQVYMTCVKTMSEIEALVNKYPNLSSDYLGPVFQYLKADPELEIKMWGHLKTVANIFLFLRGSTARRVNRLLVDSGMKMGSYILLGIDEYVVANQEPRNTELAEKIKSAELLVPEDVKLKKVLKRLLRDLILINEEDLNFEMISFFPKLIVYNSSGTTTYHSKFFSLESSIPSYAQDENMSPISVLQKIYINVKKRLDLMKKIEFTKQVKLAMEQLTLQEQKNYQKTIKSLNNLEAESSAIVTFQQISTAFAEKADLESRCRLKQKKFKELTEVVKDISLKIETWDVLELKETEKELKLKLKEEELKLTEKTDEIAIKNKKLKNSIEIMENLKQFLTDTLDNTTNLGELFECIGNNKDSFIATCQEHLNEYNSKLMMNSEKIRELVGSSIDDTQHEEDLLKARCRLYEKNSERDVIINAVKQCEKHTEACKDESNFDQALYIKLRHESRETIMNEIDQCMKKIWSHKQANGLDVVSKDHYGHLVEAIKKVEQYCESPDQLPVLRNKIAARTYPVISKVFVKMLKDAVHNYRSAFNFVMSHFIKDSTLLFYTHGLFDEVSEDNFSWNCFELGRLKAMDFAVKWKRNGEQKIASATQRLIKGLLLILYIISYLSVFKFIIIHDKIFEEIDEILKEAVLKLLEVLSQHMQIIIITSDSKVSEKDSVTLNEPQPTVLGEPMDVSAEGE